MKEFWNERFGGEEYIYGIEPNKFLKENLANLPSGSILFPCEGEGRNAVFAAVQGWNVYATDQSMAGKQKALKLAEENQVSIDYQVEDILEYSPDNGIKFDALVLIYGHLPADIRKSAHEKLVDLLKPGGTFILEGFSKKQINNNTGGPKQLDMLYSAEELSEDFKGLEIQYLKETVIEIDEGDWHKGKADVFRLVGVKPLS